MADSSDSEQVSDGESDGDFEVLSGSSESEDEMNDVPMNANLGFEYAQDFITSRQRIRRFSRLHSWFKVGAVTLAEMKGFISVILNMGLIRKPSITEYWNTKFPSQDTVWFPEAVSGYIYQLSVYKGRQYDPTPQGMLQGAYVVNKLLDAAGLFNKAYHLFTDSFFSSINLAKELLSKGTLFTGTLRVNRQMPNTIKNPVLHEKESVYIRQGRILLCAYKERNGRKLVRLISSFSKAAQENDKPAMICSAYNKFMGA
ncbi:unnamed protein product [Mytilus coruscus]|uniref:PiggyBac transposable element-derived protein domain-containing protein n=1 Tax=Mytilus coruscus TaxID=42192 RepID=A0A6J8C6P9_MYTCO|nr:unnamed protein product [Mytilus coruscus]